MGEQEIREKHKQLTRRALTLLKTTVEVRQGAYREDRVIMEGTNYGVVVTFSLMKNGAPSRGLILNGEFYVSALDAGAMDGRDKTRMLVVARAVQND